MCIAILNTKEGGLIDRKTLQTCWDSNSHGAGYAFVKDGKIEIVKELKKFKLFYSQYEQDREVNPDVNFLIHFRIRTHGKINLTNTHPFRVSDELVFIHNGIISKYGNDEESDTVEFNRQVLQKLPEGFIENAGIRKLIEDAIGYSKLVFLTDEDEAFILNEKSGYWVEKNWYSNSSYKPWVDRWPKRSQNAQGAYGTTYYSRDYGSTWNSDYENSGIKNREWDNYSWDSDKQMWVERKPTIIKPTVTQLIERYNKVNGMIVPVETKDSAFHEEEKPKRKEDSCFQCYGDLNSKAEKHFGCCKKCLKDYGLEDELKTYDSYDLAE